MAAAATAQAHVQRGARQGLKSAGEKLNEALRRGDLTEVVGAATELERAVARAQHVEVEDRALAPYIQCLLQVQVPSDSARTAAARQGMGVFPQEVTVSLLSGRSARFSVTSCDSVRSLREAVAVNFGVEPYRLKLLVGTSVLTDNNASLLACDLPTDGQLLATISQQDFAKDVLYRVVDVGNGFKSEGEEALFVDAIQRTIGGAGYDPEAVNALQRVKARMAEDDEHARRLALDMRAYSAAQAQAPLRRTFAF